ncbi:VCBS domain-containing protein, partial [Thiotrichales bacterium 19X7-9]|nr:VCBS domain-containing protein [Thiotrichales bacterium 19X7-9]
LAMLSVSAGNILDNTEIQDQLTWNFNSGSEAFNYLAAGETLTLVYTIEAEDSQGTIDSHDVTITIVGSTERPVIIVDIPSGDSLSQILEVTGAGISVSDTLTVLDTDITETVSVSVTSVSEIGVISGINNTILLNMLNITTPNPILSNTEASNQFIWTFDSGNEAFSHLGDSEIFTLIYTITATDSEGAIDTQNISITIIGTNDDPAIVAIPASGDSSAQTLIETDASLIASGTLTVIDFDVTDTVTVSVTSVIESGVASGLTNSTLLSMLSVPPVDILNNTETINQFFWTFNSGNEAFDYLEIGQNIVLTYTIQSEDSQGAIDSHDVTITITGSNDKPIITFEAGDSDSASLTET